MQPSELIVKNQISRAVNRINGHGVAPLETVKDVNKIKEKYPPRKHEIRMDINKQTPVDNYKGMVNRLTKLRKGASPGSGGMRPEFIISWSKEFNEVQTANLEHFAFKHTSGSFPAWWYTVWSTVQTVALYKDQTKTSIRPLGIRNPNSWSLSPCKTFALADASLV